MLGDRHYMRRVSFEPAGRLTRGILVANAVFFVLQKILETWTEFPLVEYFFLSLAGLKEGFLYQLVTYQFLHAHLLHLLANLICIYFLGRELERILRPPDFLKLYIVSGILGGILQMLLLLVLPGQFDRPVVGASGAAFGLFAAYAALFPGRPITILLAFIIPVSFRGRTLLWIALGIALFGILFQPGSQVAHGAHLGGILGGIGFVHLLRGRNRPEGASRPGRFFSSASRGSPRPGPRVVRRPEGAPRDFVSKEIDPILDKISEHGIRSLTEEERELLRSAGSRMGGKGQG